MEKLKIGIVGSGKLAKAVLTSTVCFPSIKFIKWEEVDPTLNKKLTLIHAGSGRQVNECTIIFCITRLWIGAWGYLALE